MSPMLLLLLASTASTARAHVALTFPPARKYQLDFLDTFRYIVQNHVRSWFTNK